MILVTGSTGNVGREVVRVLKGRGIAVRAVDNDKNRITALFDADVEAMRFDFRDRRTWQAAAEGCEAMFLMRPPPVGDVDKTLNPFVDVARKAGVGQVVFLSVAHAERRPWLPHRQVELHLHDIGGDWTVLRPGFFSQNLQDAYLRDIVDDSRLFVPAGEAKVAFVDARDVAEVAASAFVDVDRHRQRAWALTGPEAVGYSEAARLLSEALGRPIRYEAATVARYAWHLRRRRGLPASQVAIQSILHVSLRNGEAEEVNPTLEELLGRRPRTLAEYIRDHAATWR